MADLAKEPSSKDGAGGADRQQRALVPAASVNEESYELLVIFRLAGQEYGLLASGVREIIRNRAATRVPNAAHSIRGVINLRGRIIPVFDLYRRLNLKEHADEGREAQAMMVVEYDDENAGLLVDRVNDVVKIAQTDIDHTSQVVEAAMDKHFTEGVVKLGNRLVTLLRLEALLEV